jgi:hypothetical protein
MITIEEGLTLNNPTAKIKSVQYEQFNNLVNVEIYFIEENSTFTHSRNYTFVNNSKKDLVYFDVIELLKTNKILKQFFQ